MRRNIGVQRVLSAYARGRFGSEIALKSASTGLSTGRIGTPTRGSASRGAARARDRPSIEHDARIGFDLATTWSSA